MAKIHLMLQGKGGAGKSKCMSMLAQYLVEMGREPHVIDTDPVNATLTQYKALNVERIELMDGDDINPRNFDQLMERITCGRDCVVDNGAVSFTQLGSYLISNDAAALLRDMDHELVIHTVVTGGQAAKDTFKGFTALIRQFPDEAKFVVWKNPFWGPVEHDGKGFEDVRAYRDNKDRVAALIELPFWKPETFGMDLSQLLESNKTFAEVLNDAGTQLMTRQRLTIIRNRIFDEIEKAGDII